MNTQVANTQPKCWVFATWVFRASGRLYPTLELELGIGDLGIHDVGYRISWVFRTPIVRQAAVKESKQQDMITDEGSMIGIK